MAKLFVGNLPFDLSDPMLEAYFEPFGEVRSAVHVVDRATQRYRGFAFVEMPNAEEARRAIQGLDGTSLGGASGRSRVVQVKEAQEQQWRPKQAQAPDKRDWYERG
jgi:RNA recognition motif-containing protein